MTDKEIRIISRKKKELFEKANPIAILKLMFEKPTEGNVRKDPKEAKEKIESFEAMRQMKMLDDLMEELGYEWDISQSLYVEKNREAKSYADAWDAVTGRKKDSEDDETDEDDSEDDDEDDEDCDECDIKDICPIREKKDSEDDETDEDDSEDDSEDDEDCDECDIKDICPIREKKDSTTIVHHHDEIGNKDFKKDLLNNPDLRIAVKGNGIAIIGEADTMKLMSLTCELLKIISKSGAGAVRATIDLYNLKTTDKTLKLHLRKQEEKD